MIIFLFEYVILYDFISIFFLVIFWDREKVSFGYKWGGSKGIYKFMIILVYKFIKVIFGLLSIGGDNMKLCFWFLGW